MQRLSLAVILLTVLIASAFTAVAFADVSVGVKKGDWIQYNVHVTGNPPGDHNIQWASMNVTDVEGTAITVDIQTLFNNGTLYPEHITFNLATGILGDDFFIPVNLSVGDQFYDKYQGNITITSIQQRTAAGAQRTVMSGATNYTTYYWDRATGILVAARSIETDQNYTMTTDTNATNIWQPDVQAPEIIGLQPQVFYATMVAVVIVGVALAVVAANWVRQRKQKPLLLSLEAVGAVFVAIFLAAYLGGMLMTPSTTVLHSEPAFKVPLIIFGVALLILILANAVLAALEKSQLKSTFPLKVGLLIVAASYFLYNLHSLFTLQWIGEWNHFGGSFSSAIFLEDTTSFAGIIARFIGGILAIGVVMFYFSRGLPSTQKTYRVLKWVLVFEAIYWISLIPTAGVNVYFALTLHMSTNVLLSNLAWTTIPSIVESIAPPIALLILTSKLGPNKPINKAIKWALISGTTYVVVFWLTNTGSWMLTVQSKSIQYLTTYPQHLLSFALTAFGLLALAIYAAYSTKKSTGAQTLQELNLRAVGAIIALLGMYFLWNYLSWVFFNGAWSDWYAWFLGHNLDLWMLSLPLLGLPLLFSDKPVNTCPNNYAHHSTFNK